MKENKYDLEDRLIDFVLIVDDIVERLPDTRLSRHIAGQMVPVLLQRLIMVKLWQLNLEMISFIS